MFDWLRNLLAPAPALAGATPGGMTLPTVLAFSEEGGGEPPAEKPAEPPPAAPPAPAPPTGDAPATESASTPTEFLGRPMMNFVTDMVAALGALLVFIAFFLPYLGTSVRVGTRVIGTSVSGFGLVLGWQGFLIALLMLFLVVSTITFWKKKNWALVYADCGGFLVVFAIIQVIIMPLGPHVGWFFTLFGGILMAAAGILQWLVFKNDALEKPWPVGVTVQVPGA